MPPALVTVVRLNMALALVRNSPCEADAEVTVEPVKLTVLPTEPLIARVSAPKPINEALVSSRQVSFVVLASIFCVVPAGTAAAWDNPELNKIGIHESKQKWRVFLGNAESDLGDIFKPYSITLPDECGFPMTVMSRQSETARLRFTKPVICRKSPRRGRTYLIFMYEAVHSNVKNRQH